MPRILALALTLFVAAVQPAAASDALQRFIGEVRTFTAQFEQVQYGEDGVEIARRSGRFALARPGRFDWRYERPYAQRVVCDGQRIWNYEPDLAQVTVRAAGDILRDTPVALLAEGANLTERFEVEPIGDGGLRLRPKAEDADFREIELWLEPSGAPRRMRLHDPLGGVSEIRFRDARRNPKIDDAEFRFEPPAGVEVVNLDPAS
ncbi:outer membrane lipoprotein chaperone LolA [Sinimarinibacterium thermocellulolyticum]|uniref:Outer-membrane lipoprotein carrier protein n=1 Tax=Sinimarinibacterium thermocellulolyticum TaxID=3170016 RepID=A0ABV2AB65_9GAMM